MFQRILVAIDGSPNSYHGLQYAIEVAKKFDAEVTLIHVVEVPKYPYSPIYGTDVPTTAFTAIEESARELFQKRSKELIEKGVRTKTLLKRGSPAVEILRASKGFDLIVIGAKGLSRFKRLLLGSVSNSVVQGSKVPVLLVRPKGSGTHGRSTSSVSSTNAIQKILVPIDGSPNSYHGLQCAVELAKKLDVEITLIHVVEQPSYAFAPSGGSVIPAEAFVELEGFAEKLLQKRRKELTNEGVRTNTLLKRGSPADEILRASKGFDLIVIGAKGLSRFKRLLLGSVSNSVVQNSKVSVLIVRPE
ncbi:MAG: universal stress protein [Nitrososphaerales archaeon]